MRWVRNCAVVLVGLVMACRDSATEPMVWAPEMVAASASVAPDQLAVLGLIQTNVQALVSAGVLNGGQGTALTAKISAALAQFASGNSNAAAGSLGAFLNQVQALAQAGVLPVADAAGLTGLAQSVTGNALVFTSITTGARHACGLAVGGYAYCWGRNDLGQLGVGSATDSPRPVLVSASQTFRWIGAGDNHTCALGMSGEATCWGGNLTGQLGDGTTTDRSVPGPVSGGHSFASVDVGAYTNCGVTTGGATYCWGTGGRVGTDFGGLGAPAPAICGGYYAGLWPCSTAPIMVTGGHAFSDVSASLWYGCGRKSTGEAYCWGWNQFYQLGNGTFTNAPAPTPVSGGLSFVSLAAGAIVGCGIDAAQAGYCWGNRFFTYGAIGDGTVNPAPTPRPVGGGLRFRILRSAKGNNIYTFTCGVTTANAAYCWGANNYGQLGAPTTFECLPGVGCSLSPIAVSGGLAFDDLSPGNGGACGVTTQGEGYCWGQNTFGQLGDGTTADRTTPTRVVR